MDPRLRGGDGGRCGFASVVMPAQAGIDHDQRRLAIDGLDRGLLRFMPAFGEGSVVTDRLNADKWQSE